MKRAIIVVSFGTSYLESLKLNIEGCENHLKNAFPEYDHYRAFTSQRIIKKLRERDNIHIDNLEESLIKLKSASYDEVYIQPLHMIAGHEYDNIYNTYIKYKALETFKKLTLGKALLNDDKDYDLLINALVEDGKRDEYYIYVGHGSSHNSNDSYKVLQEKIDKRAITNIKITTLTNDFSFQEIMADIKRKYIGEVTLAPLMLVAGDHAKNDIFGQGEDSLLSKLKEEGIRVKKNDRGLGESQNIRRLYEMKVYEIL